MDSNIDVQEQHQKIFEQESNNNQNCVKQRIIYEIATEVSFNAIVDGFHLLIQSITAPLRAGDITKSPLQHKCRGISSSDEDM